MRTALIPYVYLKNALPGISTRGRHSITEDYIGRWVRPYHMTYLTRCTNISNAKADGSATVSLPVSLASLVVIVRGI